MGQPGNPTDSGEPREGAAPDPEQAGWASPTPPPPPPGPPPAPPAPGAPPTYQQPPSEPPPTYEQPPSEPTPPPAQPPVPPSGPPTTEAPAWGAAPPALGAQQPAWGAPPPGGAAPPPPTPGWGPTGQGPVPPPKKRRLTWLWFLIPVLLVFVASVVVIAVFAVKLIGGPIDATNDYYADLKAERYAESYDHLCASLQREYTQDQFVDLLQGQARSKGRVEDYDFNNSNVNDNDNDDDEFFTDATVRGTVERGDSDYDTRVRLRKEDGDWKVCAVSEG